MNYNYVGGKGLNLTLLRRIWTKRILFYSISIWQHDDDDAADDDDDHERTRHNGGEEDDEHAEEQM